MSVPQSEGQPLRAAGICPPRRKNPVTEGDETMPKMKTRKSIAKRVKRTASGQYKFSKPGRRHLMTGKGGKRKRQLRKDGVLSAGQEQRLKKALPYG